MVKGSSTHNVYHTHTSVDVTKRHPVTRTSYFHTLLTPDRPSSVQEMSIQPERFTPDFNVDEAYLDFLADTSTDTIPAKIKWQCTAGDEPQKQWLPECDKFLKEFIRLEGRRDDTWTLLSVIWTRNYFQHGGLRDLGLCVQLGHPTGVHCCNPSAAFQDDFTVLDTTGIHTTVTNPHTAATFCVLNHFQMYTFESKGSAFEYYQSLACLTDNIRRHQTKVAGHGHNPGSVLGTMEGELAVLCPACPQPDENLPLGWETSEVKHKWLYGLFLAIDANFRLCRHNKSSKEVNPSLSKGWGYFVEETGFKYMLDAHAGQVQDKSSCTSHNAVNLADTKNSWGLAATGIGAIVCARHNLTRPSSVGTFKEEKGMARTDGEAIERGWSNMNPVATSTREMGPGSRRDILDDHFGPSLLKKLKEAILEHNQHAVDLRDFKEAIPSSSLSSWCKMVEEWEDDHSRPNPFEVQASAVTQASVRLELSQLEAHQLRQGIDDSLHPDISPNTASIGIHATNNQLSTIQQRINASRHRIEQWIQIQTLYIPSVARIRAESAGTANTVMAEEPAHAINLWMPSAVVKAHDALHELRQHLRLKRHLTGFKKNWLTGQRVHTRSHAVIDTVQAKIAVTATKYQVAWKALDALADSLLHLDWQIEFPKLKEQDIRGMTEAQAGGELESEG
ncbi:hypothetical protein F4604DRAFT_1688355 [Suillus subluteus]|nr:hypothetical protein F4604DRAFT_1688355 [Suillus subluteus]